MKFVSKNNLEVAWENGIKPAIDAKQDKLPDGTAGQVLTATDGGFEFKTMEIPDVSEQLKDYAKKSELPTDYLTESTLEAYTEAEIQQILT